MIPSGKPENNSVVGKITISNERGDDQKRIVNAKGSLNGRIVDIQFQIKGNLNNNELRKALADSFVGKTKENATGVKTTELNNKNVKGLKITVSYSDVGLASDLNQIKSSGNSLNNVFRKTDSLSRQLFNHIKAGVQTAFKLTESAKSTVGGKLESAKTHVKSKMETTHNKARALKNGADQLYNDAKIAAKNTYKEVKDKLTTDKESEYEVELEYNTEFPEVSNLDPSEGKKTKQEQQFDLLHDYFHTPHNFKDKFIDFKNEEFVLVDQKPKNCKAIGQEIRKFLDNNFQTIEKELSQIAENGGTQESDLETATLKLAANQFLDEKVNEQKNGNPYAPSVSKRK